MHSNFKKRLEEAGILLHKARSGRIIIRVTGKLDIGSTIFDEKGRRIGKVIELIGPVNRPYASLQPLNEKAVRKGAKVYRG